MRVVGSACVRAERIMYGSHVVDRFRQRVREDLGFPEARETLRRLIRGGHIRDAPPAGIRPGSLRDEILTVGWLTFEHADKLVVLPLMPWPGGMVATTCMLGRRG